MSLHACESEVYKEAKFNRKSLFWNNMDLNSIFCLRGGDIDNGVKAWRLSRRFLAGVPLWLFSNHLGRGISVSCQWKGSPKNELPFRCIEVKEKCAVLHLQLVDINDLFGFCWFKNCVDNFKRCDSIFPRATRLGLTTSAKINEVFQLGSHRIVFFDIEMLLV